MADKLEFVGKETKRYGEKTLGSEVGRVVITFHPDSFEPVIRARGKILPRHWNGLMAKMPSIYRELLYMQRKRKNERDKKFLTKEEYNEQRDVVNAETAGSK